MNKSLLFLSLMLTASCGDVDGIWMVQFSYPTEVEDCVKEATDWNFIGAQVPAESVDISLWTTEESSSISDSMAFVQIVDNGDSAVLIWNDMAYPSIGAGSNGAWTFEWVAKETSSYEADHFMGYSCSEEIKFTDTTTFTVMIDGNQLAGSMTISNEVVENYEESDIWSNEEVGAEQCAVPASSYLETIETLGTYIATTNDSLTADCSAASCVLKVEQHCATSYDFTGVKTGYEDEAAYNNVDEAGHDFGL